MTETIAKTAIVHPMVKFQRQVESLVKKSKVVKPQDPIWKIAFLFGDDWAHWRRELEDFDFSMQDPIADLLAVQSWEED
jgi:hypothetical protein